MEKIRKTTKKRTKKKRVYMHKNDYQNLKACEFIPPDELCILVIFKYKSFLWS